MLIYSGNTDRGRLIFDDNTSRDGYEIYPEISYLYTRYRRIDFIFRYNYCVAMIFSKRDKEVKFHQEYDSDIQYRTRPRKDISKHDAEIKCKARAIKVMSQVTC